MLVPDERDSPGFAGVRDTLRSMFRSAVVNLYTHGIG
jgi:hypothetical protein